MEYVQCILSLVHVQCSVVYLAELHVHCTCVFYMYDVHVGRVNTPVKQALLDHIQQPISLDVTPNLRNVCLFS